MKIVKMQYKVLGLDLGLSNFGYAVLKTDFTTTGYLTHNCIYTSKHKSNGERMVEIYNILEEIIEYFKPDIACIERVFHNTNTKTFSVINQIHGICILLLEQKQLPYMELTPIQVKETNGLSKTSNKKVVTRFITNKFKLQYAHNKTDDAYDALAIANSCIIRLI